MRDDVTVQVERGGVTLTVSRGQKRSGRLRRSRWRRVRGHLLEMGRSLILFLIGLLMASLIGVTTLFLQNQPLWFCVYSTMAVAAVTAFGIGLSAGVRADILMMLPSLCSARGKNFLLFVFGSVLLSGPLTNTLENTTRATTSLLCGVELATNQTHMLMQRAATPFFLALERIQQVSSNIRTVAGRVQTLVDTLSDTVRHVASSLRNVLFFLVNIGEVCNAKLSTPYRKCQALFREAHADCVELIGSNFVCDLIDSFMNLCELARATEIFCIIPSYVANHLKTHLAAPTVSAFRRMKQEFDFNFSSTVQFDVDINVSRSMRQVTQDIMEDVSSELQLLQTLSNPLTYGGLLLLAWSFLKAVLYRRRYIRDITFDNFYITAQFKELDQWVNSMGGTSVLPIRSREAQTYITPLSLRLTNHEQRIALMGVASVLKHLMIGSMLVMLDFLVFWILDQVHHLVKGDITARAPVMMAVQVQGSGYASDIFRDLVSSFDILQGGNITIISRKCLLEPSEPDYTSCFILGFLLGLALLVSVSAGFVKRSRRLICAACHPEREEERIRFLRQQIVDQRRAEWKALRAVARIRTDGVGGASCLQTRLLRLAGGAHLCHLLGLYSLTCVTCGVGLKPGEKNMATCDVPQCSGVYCWPCFLSLGNICVVCTEDEESETETDESSDDIVGPFHSIESSKTSWAQAHPETLRTIVEPQVQDVPEPSPLLGSRFRTFSFDFVNKIFKV